MTAKGGLGEDLRTRRRETMIKDLTQRTAGGHGEYEDAPGAG
jgi:hypothetical protein